MSFKALLRLCSPAPAFATHRLHGGPVNLNGACHLSTAACVARHPVREWSSQSPKQGLSVPQRSTVEPCIATMCRRSRCDSPLAAVSGPSVHRQTKAMAQNKVVEEKEARKAAKRQAKAEKRAKREGTLASGSKECDLCGESKDLLIRCADTCIYLLPCVSIVL
jgi:hypothetical protein